GRVHHAVGPEGRHGAGAARDPQEVSNERGVPLPHRGRVPRRGPGCRRRRRPGWSAPDRAPHQRGPGAPPTRLRARRPDEPVIARAAMKPLSTLRTPLRSVDLATKEPVEAVVERSDVCAGPAAGIVGEAMMAIVLASAFLEKFGGDSLEEIRRNYDTYLASLKTW